MRRRAWLTAGVALAATAGGAGLAWRRLHAPDSTAAEADFWSRSLPTPEGTTLALSRLRGHPLVVNFWASWCPPCVRELPAIERFYQAHRAQGWQVLGIAVDRDAAVRDFLRHTPVSFPVVLAGFEGATLARGLGNPAGALPFTLLMDRKGRVRERKLGETSFEELSAWARAAP